MSPGISNVFPRVFSISPGFPMGFPHQKPHQLHSPRRLRDDALSEEENEDDAGDAEGAAEGMESLPLERPEGAARGFSVGILPGEKAGKEVERTG